jgi:hypothetical protein
VARHIIITPQGGSGTGMGTWSWIAKTIQNSAKTANNKEQNELTA